MKFTHVFIRCSSYNEGLAWWRHSFFMLIFLWMKHFPINLSQALFVGKCAWKSILCPLRSPRLQRSWRSWSSWILQFLAWIPLHKQNHFLGWWETLATIVFDESIVIVRYSRDSPFIKSSISTFQWNTDQIVDCDALHRVPSCSFWSDINVMTSHFWPFTSELTSHFWYLKFYPTRHEVIWRL